MATHVAKKYDLPYPIICVEKKEIYDLIFQLGFPVSMVTDRNGIISFIKCGGPTEVEKAREIVNSMYVNEIEHLLLVK